MSQTKKQSVREVVVDTIIGITIAVVLNWSVLVALQGSDPSLIALVLTVIFTILSVVRKYCTRRFFNKRDG